MQIGPTAEFPRVYAILMDWPLGTNVITLFSSCLGDASIYSTSTFGIIGGIGHERVRIAVKDFVKIGEAHFQDSVATKEFPLPKPGKVYFYLVCFDGVRRIESDEESLKSRKDKFLDLYGQGQRVITELRTVSELKK